MRREILRTVEAQAQLPGAVAWVTDFVGRGLAAGPVQITLGRPRRTLDQNAKLWPMLSDVARHVPMVINGREVMAAPEDWKDVFTAALRREQRMAQGIDGGLVILGARTSKMNKSEFADLIELIYSHGAEHGVHWSEPAKQAFAEYREA